MHALSLLFPLACGMVLFIFRVELHTVIIYIIPHRLAQRIIPVEILVAIKLAMKVMYDTHPCLGSIKWTMKVMYGAHHCVIKGHKTISLRGPAS